MKVALIDSGVNAHHSHVGGPVRGVAVVQDEQGLVGYGPEFRDRLGHGTAVAGCIRLFAPTVELLAVSVFDGGARASAAQLAAAIDWAVAEGALLINLSLGSANPADRPVLAAACAAAAAAGALVVSAAPSDGSELWPACLPGVLGVRGDMALAPDALAYVAGDAAPWRALGRPRPLPGAAEARNFKGSSFAAARLTGLLARLEGHDAAGLLGWLETQKRPAP